LPPLFATSFEDLAICPAFSMIRCKMFILPDPRSEE
jgi:hypothetical protein